MQFNGDFNPGADELPLVFKAELKGAPPNLGLQREKGFNGQLGVLDPRNPWKQKQKNTTEIPFQSGKQSLFKTLILPVIALTWNVSVRY